MKIELILSSFLFLSCVGSPAPQQAAVSETAESEAIEAPQYIDMTMSNPFGKAIKVSDYVGKSKYVLIDFWASWCGPCRAEMPAVVEAYKAFHDKGFEVIGVSFDNNKDAWMQAIDQLGMSWPQMSDLKGWDSEGAKIYSIHAIPSNVLIDEQGRIVAKNLRGKNIFNTLATLLK